MVVRVRVRCTEPSLHSPPSRLSPASLHSCRWSRPRDRRSRPRSRRRLVPTGLCRHPPLLVSSPPSLQHGGRRLYTNLRLHNYLTGRRRLVRHQPSLPSCRRSRPRDRRDRRSRPCRTLSPPAASLVILTISSTFSSKSAIAKFRNARQTKMADVDSNIQHRQVTLKNHCI